MMKLTFLAVVIVMIVLIGFVLLVLRSLTISAGIRIRADMVKLLQSYDRILEEKSREIKRLQKELEEMPDPAARPEPVQSEPVSAEPQERGSASIPEAAEYRHSAFSDSYGAVRDYFMLSEQDKQALVEQVRKEEAGTPRGATAAALRQSLSYDTVFRMTLLSPEEQLRLLDTSLNDNDWTLLRDFCEEQGDTPFNITRFCDWLEELSHLESGEILVRGSGDASGDGQNGICEGIRIVVGNKLYDYSIDEREIS